MTKEGEIGLADENKKKKIATVWAVTRLLSLLLFGSEML